MSASGHRFAAIVLATGLLAGCTAGGGASAAAGTTGAGTQGSTSPMASGSSTVIAIGTASSPSLGTYLTGPDGKTLYIRTSDAANTTTCTAACATAWPPLTAKAEERPAAGDGVTGQLGTFSRPDGGTQVTYAGMPLYYYASDAKPGDTIGQGIGGVWFVASASGVAPTPSGSGRYGY